MNLCGIVFLSSLRISAFNGPRSTGFSPAVEDLKRDKTSVKTTHLIIIIFIIAGSFKSQLMDYFRGHVTSCPKQCVHDATSILLLLLFFPELFFDIGTCYSATTARFGLRGTSSLIFEAGLGGGGKLNFKLVFNTLILT